MSTPHIAANVGEIAERVLLPGDPKRAEHIAKKFLEGAKLYSDVRNVYGFTGTYKGVEVSIQATGMGIPSFSIYVHELINVYGAKQLIRVGTCGGMHKDVQIRDILIAQGVTTDSSLTHQIFGGAVNYALIPNFRLLETAVGNARKFNMPVKVGNVVCVDRFYNDYYDPNGVFGDGKRSLDQKLVQYGILAVDMESAALYALASGAGVDSLAIFTCSDHLLTGERLSTEERELSFNDMVSIALETIIN